MERASAPVTADAAHDRGGLADRVGAADRRAGADACATSGSPRSSRRTRCVAALEQWPQTGVPDNPGAWLMATAKHRAIDPLRRGATLERKQQELVRELERRRVADRDAPRSSDDVGDDLLRLVFIACHPVLSRRGAGRAHAAAARRAHHRRRSRARSSSPSRRSRSASCAPSARSPRRTCRSRCRAATSSRARLASVLEVIYLVFNEGYAATAGDDWMRPALCEEALRLGRVLAELAPREPEVHGLVALMEIQASRAARARRPATASRCCCSTRTARAGTSC